MRMPFAKPDPIADASATVDTLAVRHARLSERLAGAVERVEIAQAARLSALTDGDPTPAELGKLDRACLEAAGTRAGLDDAVRTIAGQLADATAARDALQDVATRAQLAADAERRAAAIDAASEALATAAGAFNDARAAMVTAVAEHGAVVVNPLSTAGTPPWLVCQPIVAAALRAANPGREPATDGLGAALDTDCALVMRRGQSGRLRDHAEDLRAGKVPAAELPRPGVAAPDPHNHIGVKFEVARVTLDVPISYLGQTGAMLQAEPGDCDLPAAVAAAAKESGWAFDLGTPSANATKLRLKVEPPDYMKTRGRKPGHVRYFVDVEAGVVDSGTSDRLPRTPWPDDRKAEARG